MITVVRPGRSRRHAANPGRSTTSPVQGDESIAAGPRAL